MRLSNRPFQAQLPQQQDKGRSDLLPTIQIVQRAQNPDNGRVLTLFNNMMINIRDAKPDMVQTAVVWYSVGEDNKGTAIESRGIQSIANIILSQFWGACDSQRNRYERAHGF